MYFNSFKKYSYICLVTLFPYVHSVINKNLKYFDYFYIYPNKNNILHK